MLPMSSSATPTPAPATFPTQQFQPENTHVGMTLIPDTQFDFASLNINNGAINWGGNNGFGFQQPRVFAVHELPAGPVNPLDTEAMSGKGYSAIFSAEDHAIVENVKSDFPVIQRPVQSNAVSFAPIDDDDEDDLYSAAPAPCVAPAAPCEMMLPNADKAFAHFSLVVVDEANETHLAERLERRIASMESVFQRVAAMTSMLDL
jgi:hypothetical protein